MLHRHVVVVPPITDCRIWYYARMQSQADSTGLESENVISRVSKLMDSGHLLSKDVLRACMADITENTRV